MVSQLPRNQRWGLGCNNHEAYSIRQSLVYYHWYEASNTITMRFLCIFAMLMVAPYCIAAQQASLFEFLTGARVNLGLNAGLRLPQLPTLIVEDREIPVPLPDLATVEIPIPYLQLNIAGRGLPATKSYH